MASLRRLGSIGVLVALTAALTVVSTSSAFASGTPRTTTGSLVSYSRSGTLVVKVRKTRQRFTVNHSTTCGVDHGSSGGPIRCGTLRDRKYAGRPVRVTWTKRNSRNIASLVVVTAR